MVITLRINGQSAGKDSKSDMPGYESPSTTAGTKMKKSCKRVSVDKNGLAILRLLKV